MLAFDSMAAGLQAMISVFMLFIEQWSEILHVSDATESNPRIVVVSGRFG